MFRELLSEFDKTGVIDAIGDPICIQDRDFRILLQNQRHKDIVGERLGEYCYSAVHKRDKMCDGCHVAMTFKDGKVHTVERMRVTDDGIQYSENTASPLRDSHGKIVAGIEIVRDITKRKETEKSLQKAKDDLEKRVSQRTGELEQSNAALKVLLKHRENDKTELEYNILSNVKHLVFPYLDKLKRNKSMSEDLIYLDIIESNINEIISPFSHKLSFRYLDFSPREILIANLIKDGKQDKDISEILNVSLHTVKTHRQNIRKKLGIYGKKINLRTKLMSLSD